MITVAVIGNVTKELRNFFFRRKKKYLVACVAPMIIMRTAVAMVSLLFLSSITQSDNQNHKNAVDNEN